MSELKSGQQCNRCLSGRMTVRSVYDSAEWHTRYLCCTICGACGQQVMRAEDVQRRNSAKQISGVR